MIFATSAARRSYRPERRQEWLRKETNDPWLSVPTCWWVWLWHLTFIHVFTNARDDSGWRLT